MTETILSRDEVILRRVGDLDPATSINDSDELAISQGGVTRKTNLGDIFASVADEAVTDVEELRTEILTALGDYVNVSTNQSIAGIKTFTDGSRITKAAGTAAGLSLASGSSDRWVIEKNSVAETGSNAGSNFVISSINDDGTTKTAAVTITRSNRAVSLAGTLAVTGNATIGGTLAVTGQVTIPSPTGATNAARRENVDTVQTNLDTHTALTNNPHTVTAAQVGNTTAQWNANQLQGRALNSTAPTTNQVISWNGSAWAPVTPAAANITSAVTTNTSQTITGAKTFSGTTIVPVASGSTEAAQLSQITAAQVGNTTAQWNANQLQGSAVQNATPTNGQTLVYVSANSRYEPQSVTGLTGSAQTIDGVKTFTSSPIIPTPTLADDTTKAATTAWFKAKSRQNAVICSVSDVSNSSTINTYVNLSSGITESIDTDSIHSAGVITVPATGFYELGFATKINAVSGTDFLDNVFIGFRRNGANEFATIQQQVMDPTNNNVLITVFASGTVPVSLTAGDTIQPQFYVGTSAAGRYNRTDTRYWFRPYFL